MAENITSLADAWPRMEKSKKNPPYCVGAQLGDFYFLQSVFICTVARCTMHAPLKAKPFPKSRARALMRSFLLPGFSGQWTASA